MSNKAAFIVNIVAPPGSLDVNLTPDKREVLLEHEGVLIRALKEYLEELFAPSRYTFKVSQGLNMNAYAVSSQDHSDFMEITDAKEAARSNMESAEETKSGHPEPDALPRSSSQESKGPVLLPAFDLKEILAHFSSSFSTRKQQQSSPHDSIHTSPAKRRRPSPLSPCSEESPTKRLSRILSKHVSCYRTSWIPFCINLVTPPLLVFRTFKRCV